MEYSDYPTAQDPSQQQQQPMQPQQQPQSTAPRGRGRRAYAAQQYDFNVPAASGPMYSQAQVPQPSGFQAGGVPVGAVPVQSQAGQPQVYGQPQAYPQPGYQYGQEYQAPSPNMYQQQYPGQAGVAGVTNQMQHLHVSQVPIPVANFTDCQPAPVNPLQSVDLMSTSPDVTGLYAAPPPLLLPHGVIHPPCLVILRQCLI